MCVIEEKRVMTVLEQELLTMAKSFFAHYNKEGLRERVATQVFSNVYATYDHIPSEEQTKRLASEAVKAADILIKELDK